MASAFQPPSLARVSHLGSTRANAKANPARDYPTGALTRLQSPSSLLAMAAMSHLTGLGAAPGAGKLPQALTDLGSMLESLSPELRPGVWVYAVLPEGTAIPVCAAAVVGEAEGRTVVLRETEAKALGLTPLFRGRWITLRVHSSLTAVGLTARVAAALATHNIPANVLAGCCHDHLLVPEDLVDQALTCLRHWQEDAGVHPAYRERDKPISV